VRPDPLAEAAARRHELTRAKAIQALRELDRRRTRHLRLRRRGSRYLPLLALYPARHQRPGPQAPRCHP